MLHLELETTYAKIVGEKNYHNFKYFLRTKLKKEKAHFETEKLDSSA